MRPIYLTLSSLAVSHYIVFVRCKLATRNSDVESTRFLLENYVQSLSACSVQKSHLCILCRLQVANLRERDYGFVSPGCSVLSLSVWVD